MSALVKTTALEQHAATQAGTAGFGPLVAPAPKPADQFRRAVMTMVLVLYPAMATAAVVIAALVFSGAQPIV